MGVLSLATVTTNAGSEEARFILDPEVELESELAEVLDDEVEVSTGTNPDQMPVSVMRWGDTICDRLTWAGKCGLGNGVVLQLESWMEGSGTPDAKTNSRVSLTAAVTSLGENVNCPLLPKVMMWLAARAIEAQRSTDPRTAFIVTDCGIRMK
jgi:hypothetical protein